MSDGHYWLTKNMDLKTAESYCIHDSSQYCKLFGRLYTWNAAQKVCTQLGNDWHLPSDEEWNKLAKAYGGRAGDSNDHGASAFRQLIKGGDSKFEALLGGNREPNGQYERTNAHGFYWTSTADKNGEAWFYNFGNGMGILNHHSGTKQRALSVRCIQ